MKNWIINTLAASPVLVVGLIHEVPTELRKRRPAHGKWSAHEHACHLAAVQPLFNARLDMMLREDNPEIIPYFPGKEDEGGALLERNLEEELQRFTRDRAALVERIKELKPHEWERPARHGEYNQYSVRIMFRHLAMHDMIHAYRIEEVLLKKEWP